MGTKDGRPSKKRRKTRIGTIGYSTQLADRICAWVASGKTLSAFCRQPKTPPPRTIYGWLAEFPEFAAEFARSRCVGCDVIADEVLEISDTPKMGEVTTVDEEGTKVVSADMLGHRKLQVDARLKLLAKWYPGRYGEKLGVEHSGEIARPAASREEAVAELAAILATAAARREREEEEEA